MTYSRNGILGAFSIIFVLTIVSKLFGFAEKQIIAYYFGTNWQVDVYFLVLNLSLMFNVFFEELIQPTFLPLFLDFKKTSSEKAHKLFNSFFLLLTITSIVVMSACLVFSETIITIFAPGFSGEKLELAISLFKIMAFSIVFQGVSVLLYYYLNSFKLFFIPALSQSVFKVISAVGIIVFFNLLGVKSLALAFLLAMVFKFAVVLVGVLAKKVHQLTSIHFKNIGLRKLFYLMLPLLIGTLFSQLSGRVDDYFASQLPDGMLSALNYAKKVVDLPLLIIPYSLGIVLFPYFSEMAVKITDRENELNYRALFKKWFEIILFSFILVELYFMLMGGSLIKLLFERGAFNNESTLLTTKVFVCYAVGIVAFALEILIMQVYFSFEDTKTPILVGIACVILNIVLTVFLIRHLYYLAIALAFVVQKTVKLLILVKLLKRKITLIEKKEFGVMVANTVLPCICGIGVLVIANLLLASLKLGDSELLELLNIILTSMLFFGTALFIAFKKDVFYIRELTSDAGHLFRKLIVLKRN